MSDDRFGLIRRSIFNSSLAENVRARHLFMDMITLAGGERALEMGPKQISLRTGIPLEHVVEDLEYLLAPDPYSATTDHEGRRLLPLDPDNANAGYIIVNLDKHKSMTPERERARKAAWARKNRSKESSTRVNLTVDTILVNSGKVVNLRPSEEPKK